jgi:hypothetical protein
MSNFQHKPNTGALFPNEKKNENSPSMTGTITLENGKIMRIATWTKTGAKGRFLSVQISELKPNDSLKIEETPKPQQAKVEPATDDLPF